MRIKETSLAGLAALKERIETLEAITRDKKTVELTRLRDKRAVIAKRLAHVDKRISSLETELDD